MTCSVMIHETCYHLLICNAFSSVLQESCVLPAEKHSLKKACLCDLTTRASRRRVPPGAAIPRGGADAGHAPAEVSGGAPEAPRAAAGRAGDQRAGEGAQHPHLPAQQRQAQREEEERQIQAFPPQTEGRKPHQPALRWGNAPHIYSPKSTLSFHCRFLFKYQLVVYCILQTSSIRSLCRPRLPWTRGGAFTAPAPLLPAAPRSSPGYEPFSVSPVPFVLLSSQQFQCPGGERRVNESSRATSSQLFGQFGHAPTARQ